MGGNFPKESLLKKQITRALLLSSLRDNLEEKWKKIFLFNEQNIRKKILKPKALFLLQNNEVNQGDALEHNFSAVYSALLLPVSHIFPTQGFPQVTPNESN